MFSATLVGFIPAACTRRMGVLPSSALAWSKYPYSAMPADWACAATSRVASPFRGGRASPPGRLVSQFQPCARAWLVRRRTSLSKGRLVVRAAPVRVRVRCTVCPALVVACAVAVFAPPLRRPAPLISRPFSSTRTGSGRYRTLPSPLRRTVPSAACRTVSSARSAPLPRTCMGISVRPTARPCAFSSDT